MDIHMISRMGDHQPNEDFTACIQMGNTLCAMVADGLGGHGCGEVASRAAVEAAMEFFKSHAAVQSEIVMGCFMAAQEALARMSRENRDFIDMKTTMAILVLDDQNFVMGHLGDTRIYVLGKHDVCFQTLDHSVPQALVAGGKLKAKQIRYHADRNRLMRVLETGELPRPDVTYVTKIPAETMAFLLCTDGFWEHVKEERMIKHLRKAMNAEQWLSYMEMEVLQNAKKSSRVRLDNYSGLAIRV